MGFLEAGLPMEWEDTEEYYNVLEYVIKHGALQFLEVFNRVKNRRNDVLKWGDEVEYHIGKINSEDNGIQIHCKAHNLIKKLEEEDKMLAASNKPVLTTWHPEYGSWMIEATPSEPYGKYSADLRKLEQSLRYRRYRIQKALNEGEKLVSMAVWPRMGCEKFVENYKEVNGVIARSNFLPDSVINPHPRFGTLTRNIRKRRGKKVNIHVPLFIDQNTDSELIVAKNDSERIGSEIYMDAMGFGMGCCCLQVTFQARDLSESRHLFDQLAVLCPIFLSLSAASPIFKGLLASTDVRWNTIVQSVDCRTSVEYGEQNKSDEQKRRGAMKIRKSRYDSIDLYISDSPLLKPEYNDLNAEVHQPTYDLLLNNGVDKILSKHIAHLFIRDPLVIFSDRINVDDQKTTEHFENIQSTNWQTMRWKPPPASSAYVSIPMHSNGNANDNRQGTDFEKKEGQFSEKDANQESVSNSSLIGWRVEFRPMEIQLTDFENAAYTICIVLLTRVILFFNLNLYLPLSKVDANMQTAHVMDSVTSQKFFFRKNLVPLETECNPVSGTETREPSSAGGVDNEYELMTIAEILTGKGENFPGLIPLIHAYLEIIDCDKETLEMVDRYLDFLKKRSEGRVMTIARYIRNFVLNHPSYKKDSVVSQEIEADLIKHCSMISNGEVHDEKLLGDSLIKKLDLSVDISSYKFDSELHKEPKENLYTTKAFLEGLKEYDLKKLRGSSFISDINNTQENKREYECQIIKDLVKKYKNQKREFVVKEQNGFSSTPAFLGKQFGF